MNDTQFRRQTAGWAESERELQRVLEEQGPFGVGFSQCAAVAAVLAAQQAQQQRRQQLRRTGSGSPGKGCSDGGCKGSSRPAELRFAIMCSGYRFPMPEHASLLDAAAAVGGAGTPTLHIYGAVSAELHAM